MEKLAVKNLGPIKDFEMTTNRLTVLIGPQASGKSLLAQMLFFFNEFPFILSSKYPIEMSDQQWFVNLLHELLASLRATPFQNYMGPLGRIVYSSDEGEFEIVRKENVFESAALKHKASMLFNLWKVQSKSISEYINSRNLFVPTERALYTRLRSINRAQLYSDKMPYVFRLFTYKLDECSVYYSAVQAFMPFMPEPAKPVETLVSRLEKSTLQGRISYSGPERLVDEWVLDIVSNDGASTRIPMHAASSGQMETWPFFTLAHHYGEQSEPYTFYFEEPETHLHPQAQVEVVKTIAYLISRGHRFVITTHSPFILYVINNLIQAHIAYNGSTPDGEFSINPEHVAAYCLGDNPRSIVSSDTKLLDLKQIDSVFDSINRDFEKYMDMEFTRGGDK